MADHLTRCTCGSGAHPRQCEFHPEWYRVHCAQLNLDSYLPESGEDELPAVRAMLELERAYREYVKSERKTAAKVAFEFEAAFTARREDREKLMDQLISSYSIPTLRDVVTQLIEMRGNKVDRTMLLDMLETRAVELRKKRFESL